MGIKIITTNKNAFFEYEILERFEAGIVLEGAEVKSIKAGDVNLKDSFCHIEEGELFLKNCHITPYQKGSYFNAEARRNRKLLMHKAEISRLIGKIQQKGFTLVPIKLYFKENKIKAEIGLAKGKQLHDKRQSLKEKDMLRDAQREIKNYK